MRTLIALAGLCFVTAVTLGQERTDGIWFNGGNYLPVEELLRHDAGTSRVPNAHCIAGLEFSLDVVTGPTPPQATPSSIRAAVNLMLDARKLCMSPGDDLNWVLKQEDAARSASPVDEAQLAAAPDGAWVLYVAEAPGGGAWVLARQLSQLFPQLQARSGKRALVLVGPARTVRECLGFLEELAFQNFRTRVVALLPGAEVGATNQLVADLFGTSPHGPEYAITGNLLLARGTAQQLNEITAAFMETGK